MPRDDKYEYTKLNEIESCNLKEFNIYGIIKEVAHKTTYDRRGEVQDEYRLKLNDGTTGNEDINITAFVKTGQIPANVFEEGKIARFHRLTKNSLKNNGGFYLGGRIGSLSSVLVFNIPTHGSRFKFNPSFRSSINFTHTDKDDEILADLISKADEILGRHPITSASSPPQASPPLRRSPRKTPQRASTTQVPKTQPTSAVKTPTRQQQRRNTKTQQTPTSTRRSARLRGQSPEEEEIQIDESSSEEEEVQEEVAVIDEPVAEVSQENIQQQTDVSPVARSQPQRQPDISPASRIQQQQRRAYGSPPQANERELFTEISHLVCGNSNYYNILCQIVSCYRSARGHLFLRVWDGTRNPRLTKFMNFNKHDLVYGNLRKEKRITADKKLYEIACFGEHSADAANLKPDDYIALINLHFFFTKNASEPSLVMHDGEGTIKTDEGTISAGRKIVKLIAEEHRTAFRHIDGLIQTHEPDLPVLEDEEENEIDGGRGTQYSDATWNDFLGIEPRSSPIKERTVAPTQQIPTQASTITVSSDGSTQSCIVLSQTSPTRNVEIVRENLAGAAPSSRNHFYPKPRFTPASPYSTNSSPFRRSAAGPSNATLPPRPQPMSGIFARRPQPIQFDTASQISSSSQQQQPTEPKRPKLSQSPQKSQSSTQSIFDKLIPEIDIDDCSSQSQPDELRRVLAITETQLEDMWAEVENPDFQ